MSTPTTSSSTTSLTQQLAQAFSTVGLAYERWVRDQLRESELSATHIRSLCELRDEGPMIMSALGDALGVTPRYVTTLVDALERDGLVRRLPHADDRRATLVELTEKGERACLGIGETYDRINAELVGVLGERQQRQLLEALETLLAVLRRRGYSG